MAIEKKNGYVAYKKARKENGNLISNFQFPSSQVITPIIPRRKPAEQIEQQLSLDPSWNWRHRVNLCFEGWREGWIQRKTAYGEQQLLENLNSWGPSFGGPPITQVLSFIYTQNIHFSATQAYSQRKLPDPVWSRVRSIRQLKPTLASLSHVSWGENSW